MIMHVHTLSLYLNSMRSSLVKHAKLLRAFSNLITVLRKANWYAYYESLHVYTNQAKLSDSDRSNLVNGFKWKPFKNMSTTRPSLEFIFTIVTFLDQYLHLGYLDFKESNAVRSWGWGAVLYEFAMGLRLPLFFVLGQSLVYIACAMIFFIFILVSISVL